MTTQGFTDLALEAKALDFATVAHEGQFYDGLPYVRAHLMVVADIGRIYTKDSELISMFLLHDTIEDTPTTYEELLVKFGKRIADGVFCLTDGAGKNRAERKVESYRKLRQNKDARLGKICDRIANMEASVGKPHALMYIREMKKFKAELYFKEDGYDEAWNRLDKAFALLVYNTSVNR